MRYKMLTTGGAIGSLVLSAQLSGATTMAAGTSAVPIDACALLLPSEISRVIEIPVEAGARQDAGLQANGAYSSTCVWTIKTKKAASVDPTAPLGGKSFVILNAMQWPNGSGLAHTFLDAFRKAAVNGDIPHTPTPRKIGDEALWWGDGLAVRKDDVSFGLSVFITGSHSKRTSIFEEQLAPRILQRIERRE